MTTTLTHEGDLPTTSRWAIKSAHGLSPSALNRARSILAQQSNASWQLGDLLVAVYGAPPPAHHPDGSHAQMAALATELGCGVSTLVHSRICAAAWPAKHRRLLVAWTVHRRLSARPDRFELLEVFCRECEREGVTASPERLASWLAAHTPPSSRGRPRTAGLNALMRAVERVEQEPSVDPAAVLALIERLRRLVAVAA